MKLLNVHSQFRVTFRPGSCKTQVHGNLKVSMNNKNTVGKSQLVTSVIHRLGI